MPTNKPSPVRHAIARSTGATTLAQKTEDGWKIDCLNHGSTVTVPSRGKAWVTGSHPQDFCAKWKAIAAGKAEKITGDRLDIPKAAPKKTPAKPYHHYEEGGQRADHDHGQGCLVSDGNRIDYEAVAEELDDPATRLDDLDWAVVAAAQRYATATEMPCPPKPTHTRFTDWSPETFNPSPPE